MTAADWISVIGGTGVLLFSLRNLTRVLRRSLNFRVRDAFSRALAHPVRGLVAGVVVTVLVQASSITILTAMGLLGSTIITFEQAYFVMLGATLGTTLKAWFIGLDLLRFGPLLVGLCSLLAVFARRPWLRLSLECLTAIGFAFWGLDLITTGLHPLIRTPFFLSLLEGYPGVGLAQQLAGTVTGGLLACAVQSSSAIVALIISLGHEGVLTFPQGAALVLGANFGSVVPPLLASFEHDVEMKRLAVAHLLVKLFGVGIALFFFPSFLGVIELMVPEGTHHAATRLAAVHTCFNLFNMIGWALCSGLIFRLVTWLLPDKGQPGLTLALAPVVRKMLTRSPSRALAEARRQVATLTVCVKSWLDYNLSLLAGERPQNMEERAFQQREFEGLKDSIHELLVGVLRTHPNLEVEQEVRKLLVQLADFEELYALALRLRESLEVGLSQEGYRVPQALHEALALYQRGVDEQWLAILFGDGAPAPTLDPREILRGVGDAYFQVLRDQSEPVDSLNWIYDAISGLRGLLLHLSQMAALTTIADSEPSNS